MSKKELVKRYILFIIGLFFSGLGVAVTKYGELGVTPISSIPNILSIRFTNITIGTFLMICNVLLLIGQIIILRKNFKIVNLLQIPLSFLFGWFTDLGLMLTRIIIPQDPYPWRLFCVFLGTFLLAFGISLQVVADTILNSGEAFVKAISDTIHKEFGYVKVAFDVYNVTAAIVLSLIFFGSIKGAREGTIIAAVSIGFVVKFITPRIKPGLLKLLKS